MTNSLRIIGINNHSPQNKSSNHNLLLQDMQMLNTKSSTGEIVENLDKDSIYEQFYSNIDFNSRIPSLKVIPITKLQLLSINRVGGIYPMNIQRILKRNFVSDQGLGRTEKISVIQGERAHIEGKTVTSNLANKMTTFFTKNEEQK